MDTNKNENSEDMEEKTEIAPAVEESPKVCFEYDVKNSEEEEAFFIFQKKYVYKSNWIKTVAFGLLAVLFLISVIRNPEEMLNYILLAICAAVIAIIWINTKKIRKSLVEALKILENDRYIFSLYADRFTIETILSEEDFEEDEEIPVVQPRVVNFSDITLNVIENKDMFVLILKKDTIYVLPKRKMVEADIMELSSKFREILGEDFSAYNEQ